MTHLFFDSETTGLPRDYKAPPSDVDNWPRLVQIAWLITDVEGNEIRSLDAIIKPDGFEIPEGASRIHGITTARAMKEGVYLLPILRQTWEAMREASLLLAHNYSYDRAVIGAEFIRAGGERADIFKSKEHLCTMAESTEFCEIPGRRGYKWPKLIELHKKLFGQEFEGAHSALADVRACAKCYFELRSRGVVQ